MQNEVIDEILNIEAEAEKIVAEAEKEAQEMILGAQRDARSKLNAQLEAVRQEGNEQLQLANKVLESHISQYEEERERLEKEGSKIDSEVLSSMVSKVVQRISRIG